MHFLLSLSFLEDEITHKQTGNWSYAPVFFPSISVALEQICLFNVSVTAELTVPIHTFIHMLCRKGPHTRLNAGFSLNIFFHLISFRYFFHVST